MWSNGATTSAINGLHAGVYVVTVTDFSNNTFTDSIELLQPDAMQVHLVPTEYPGGTNISALGANDGLIESFITGGTPPYAYTWNTNFHEPTLGGLTQGAYTLTVTDATSCIASANVILNAPSALHIVSITSPQFNGFNLPCNDSRGANINLNVAGGIPPYTFLWNNGSFDKDLQYIQPGHYMVRVFDFNGAEVDGQITLTAPTPLQLQFAKSHFTGDFNIGCNGCSNGSIQSQVSGGVSPYTYAWASLQTTPTISNISAGLYGLHVIDANGCSIGAETTMLQPDRIDWTPSGNANTNPNTQFIGTVDSTDLVFKTNNVEGLRIKSNGDLKLNNLAGSDVSLLYSDQDGLIQKIGIGNGISRPPIVPWYTTGNTSNTGLVQDFIGPTNNQDFIIKTGSKTLGTLAERVRVTTTGKVSIGIPLNLMRGTYLLYVADGILTEKVKVAIRTSLEWSDNVFYDEYKLLPILELKDYIDKHKHLIGIPSADEIVKDGGIDLAKMDALLLKKIEEQTLYLIDMQEQIVVLKKQLAILTKK